MSPAPQILVCGEALFDVFRADGGDRAVPAGSPFNVAVGLARLGAAVAFLGAVSSDSLGGELRAALAAEGVDIRWLKASSRPTPRVLIDTTADGQPAYTFQTLATAEQDMSAADLPAKLPPGLQAIAMGSYALAVEPIAGALTALAEREAGQRVVSLDPNLRPALAGPLPAWRSQIERLARAATIVKLSDEDLHLGWPGVDGEGLAARWLEGGAALVVLTRGAEGATAWTRLGRLDVTARPTAVVDTVGAGDAFHAGLLAALRDRGRLTRSGLADLDTETLAAVLDLAATTAALTCARRGADPPRRADLPASAS